MNRKTLQIVIGFAITAACLFFVFKHVDFAALKSALLSADYRLVIAAVAAYMTSMLVRSVRLHFLLRPIKSVPVLNLFPIIIVGYAANNLLPFRLGEVVRAYFTGEKEKVSRSASFAALIVERIFDGLSVALILSIGLFSMRVGDAQDMMQLRSVLWLGGGAFMGAFLVCLGLVFQREATLQLIERIFSFEAAGISEKVMGVVHKLVAGLEVLRSAKDSVIVLLLSLLVWTCEGAMYACIGISLGFGDQVPFTNELVVLAIINLFIMVPSTPGFAGTFEAAGVWTLSKFGVGHDQAVAYTLLIHLGQYIPTTLLGMFYMWKYNLSLTKASSGGEEVEPSEPSRPSYPDGDAA